MVDIMSQSILDESRDVIEVICEDKFFEEPIFEEKFTDEMACALADSEQEYIISGNPAIKEDDKKSEVPE